MIPKSKHAIPQYLEIFSPSQVVRDLPGMLATIDLDDEFGLQAEEIHDVGSKDLLTSKLDALESPTAQATPQAPFRLGRILAQCPGQTVHRFFYPLTPALSRRARELILAHLPCLELESVDSSPGPNKQTQIIMRSLSTVSPRPTNSAEEPVFSGAELFIRIKIRGP